MGGYLYKYINNDSGDVVYVGKSKDQFTLINRLHTHNQKAAWAIGTTIEYATVGRGFDLSKAETAAINYYYVKGITQNIGQVGEMTKDEAKDHLNHLCLNWVTIDINHILPDNDFPRPGGVVVYIEHGMLLGIYIITQVVYTSRGVVYKLFSTDYCKTPRDGITLKEMLSTSKYRFWTPDLFEEMSRRYGWDHVDY